MFTSQSAIKRFDREHGIKRLTAMDNTGLYCHSNNYSKKTKQSLLAQQAKIVKKAKSKQ
ncbi:hypothetical protein [Psychrobacter sp. DAB_AL43B]|uniref:hypothetical protein n=1 Tax=Psychrobacter sp. DAB_AL43B TaxID=1028416 RepID=UPI0009C373B7|nr:hypothetical protein [Psychrobacter sp. DAB_AL43B]SLJ84469.1 hypothetical protein DABAL43B_1273 [Psychrobacter sp. DAB_AL43B]